MESVLIFGLVVSFFIYLINRALLLFYSSTSFNKCLTKISGFLIDKGNVMSVQEVV